MHEVDHSLGDNPLDEYVNAYLEYMHFLHIGAGILYKNSKVIGQQTEHHIFVITLGFSRQHALTNINQHCRCTSCRTPSSSIREKIVIQLLH